MATYHKDIPTDTDTLGDLLAEIVWACCNTGEAPDAKTFTEYEELPSCWFDGEDRPPHGIHLDDYDRYHESVYRQLLERYGPKLQPLVDKGLPNMIAERLKADLH